MNVEGVFVKIGEQMIEMPIGTRLTYFLKGNLRTLEVCQYTPPAGNAPTSTSQKINTGAKGKDKRQGTRSKKRTRKRGTRKGGSSREHSPAPSANSAPGWRSRSDGAPGKQAPRTNKSGKPRPEAAAPASATNVDGLSTLLAKTPVTIGGMPAATPSSPVPMPEKAGGRRARRRKSKAPVLQGAEPEQVVDVGTRLDQAPRAGVLPPQEAESKQGAGFVPPPNTARVTALPFAAADPKAANPYLAGPPAIPPRPQGLTTFGMTGTTPFQPMPNMTLPSMTTVAQQPG